MRHRNKTKKLGRTKAHRKATLMNLASAIIDHQQIKTTLVKAKAARSVIEKLITFGKKDTVAARRQAFKILQNHTLVQKLFNEIAPTFAERQGGYSRIIKLGQRQGDGAELAILQLVGYEPVIIEEKKTSGKKKGKAAPAKKAKEKSKEKAEAKEPEVKTEEAAEAAPPAAEQKAEEKAEKKTEPEKPEAKPKKAAPKKEKKQTAKKSTAGKEAKKEAAEKAPKKTTGKKKEADKDKKKKKEEKSE
jgi:large subunit ribosomal protein L17